MLLNILCLQNLMSTFDMEHKTTDILDAIHGSTQKTRELHSQRVRNLTTERDAGQAKVCTD